MKAGRKIADQSAAVYWAEYAQIIHHFSTLARIDCQEFARLMLTSLVHPEMVYPDKKYGSYCLKVPESGPVVQYEPISDYQMDGLQPRIDLRLGTEVPVHPEDEVDADPHFNEYPPYEEFVEGPDWTPGRIPLKYILRNIVATPVTPALTLRWPVPFRQYRSPLTRNRVEWSPPHEQGEIPVGWNSLPFWV